MILKNRFRDTGLIFEMILKNRFRDTDLIFEMILKIGLGILI
jgi:hypothetical protein